MRVLLLLVILGVCTACPQNPSLDSSQQAGLVAPSPSPISGPLEPKDTADDELVVTKFSQPDNCFNCNSEDLKKISYGIVGPEDPNVISYGCVVQEWRYHCASCDTPSTGDAKRDLQLHLQQSQRHSDYCKAHHTLKAEDE